MTSGERDTILEALHALELRFTERLVSLEVKLENHKKIEKTVQDLDKRVFKLIVAVPVLAIIALGNLAARIIPPLMGA